MGLAIITGGSSGLGFEISKLLRKRDIDICIVGRNENKLKTCLEILESINGSGTVQYHRMDISSETQVRNFGETFVNGDLSIDYLFNVAGVGKFGSPVQLKKETIDEVLASNLIGMMLLTGELLSHMEYHGGRIINVLSTAARVGKANEALYCASKWGARGYTESLKQYYKNSNIKVTAVYPGGMDTPFWEGQEVNEYMNPGEVATQIVESVCNELYVSELVIERH